MFVLTGLVVGLLQGYAWVPEDWDTLMEAGLNPTAKSVYEDTLFDYQVWCKDKDRWHRLNPVTNQEEHEYRSSLNIAVERDAVNSGTPQGQLARGSVVDGKITYTSSIRSRFLPSELKAWVYYDLYTVRDTLNINDCQYDGFYAFQMPVTITRKPADPPPPPGGGS